MNILFVSSEIYPFSKTGGLADVTGSLPEAIKNEGAATIAISPYYKETRRKGLEITDTGKRVAIQMDRREVQATILKSAETPFPSYFINQPSYFNRDFLYGDREGDYPDNAERFSFFCKAALESCKALGFQPNIIHCHDWQTGLIPAYLKTLQGADPFFKDTASIFTIHNLAYQGNFPQEFYPLTGLSWDLFNPGGLEFYQQFSFLKAGISYSDFITTVSNTYRNEILEKENGNGMDGALKNRALALEGIINGIDYRKWDPGTDVVIAANYSPGNLEGKESCRLDLMDHFGVTASKVNPIIAVVTRLTRQKGIDLIIQGLDSIIQRRMTFILLGSGEREYEEFFKELPGKYPGRTGVHIGFSEQLAHKIYAGADLFLMPSRFEPCGISQLVAMRYGAVPIVSAVGGLHDTVLPFDPVKGHGNGFRLQALTSDEMMKGIDLGAKEFRKKPTWKNLMKKIMMENHSWGPAAKKYIEIYKKAMDHQSRP